MRAYSGSGRKTLAALSATTVQYVATTLGGHAGAETVGTLALENAGLESSFHDYSSKVTEGCNRSLAPGGVDQGYGPEKRWAILVKTTP